MKFLVIGFIPFLFCAFLVARVATADTNLHTVAHAQIDELSLITRYAGMGYNILEANPEGSFYIGGADPGIKSTRYIFEHTFTEGKEAIYNGEVLDVPDQVEFMMDEACAETKVTHAYSGQTSYKSELSQYVDASGRWLHCMVPNYLHMMQLRGRLINFDMLFSNFMLQVVMMVSSL